MEHALGLGEIAQTVLTQIDERDRIVQLVADEPGGRLRAQHLTAMPDAHQPRRTIHRGAVVVTVAQFRRAGVDTDPHSQRLRQRPLLRSQRHLRGDGSVDRVVARRERSVETVTRRLHHVPATRLDRVTNDLVMARQRRLHRLRMLLPQTRRTLEISEQEGDRPRRQLGAHFFRSPPTSSPVKVAVLPGASVNEQS